MKTNFIFFDCWDTIIEYHEFEKNHSTGLNPYLLNEKKEKANNEDIDRFNNIKEEIFSKYFSQNQYELPFEMLFNLALTISGFSLSIPIEKWEDINNDYLDPKPVPGILEFLKFCRQNNIKTAVLSNSIYSYKATKKFIEDTLKINFSDYFSFMLVSSEVGPKKPNPDFFRAGMGKANIKEGDNALYIGDSAVADVLGSYNAGLKPCYFNWKNNSSIRIQNIDNLFIFKKYQELQDFILNEKEYNPTNLQELDLGVHKNEW